MSITLSVAVLGLAAALSNPEPGAVVDESRVRVEFRVDAAARGSATTFPTLSAAVRAAEARRAAGDGVRIVVAPGVYREVVRMTPKGQVGASRPPLVIEGGGKATLSGSDVFTDWKPAEAPFVEHAWEHDWGLAPQPWEKWNISMGDLARRREIVFVDGQVMRQYLQKEEAAANPGSFWVDEAGNRLLLHLPEGKRAAEAQIEVAVRDTALTVIGDRHVVIRGLRFQHTANVLPHGSVFVSDAQHVLLEDCAFEWNNWAGLKIYQVDHVTVRNCRIDHNGAMGLGATRVRHFLVEDVTANANNTWRGGPWGQFYDQWATAGAKCLNVHNAVFRRFTAMNNDIGGLWFDANNRDLVIEELVSIHNRVNGLFLEITRGPVAVRDSIIAFNGGLGRNGQGGLRLANTRQVTVERTILYGNGAAQLFSPNRGEHNRARKVSLWPEGGSEALVSGDWTFRDCVFVADSPNEALADVPFAEPPAERITGMTFERNLWWPTSSEVAFRDLGEARSFKAWQARWGADPRAVVMEPGFVDPASLDFRLRPGSPVAGWGLPTGERVRKMIESGELPAPAPVPDAPIEEDTSGDVRQRGV